jgi:Zn finger protein HypA/HybF involved in hydrogenase expression
MSAMHKATCECGYLTEITVGGNMSTQLQDSRFPFYCKHCGLVEVNTALTSPVCPNCGTADIAQYGRPPVSVVHSHKYPVLQNSSFEAGATENLCPRCQEMTLIFHPASVQVD